MVVFINDHREEYGVEPICRELPIAPSTYYERKIRQADTGRLPRRTQQDAMLRDHIRATWRRCLQKNQGPGHYLSEAWL